MSILPKIDSEESYDAAAGPVWAFRVICWIGAIVAAYGALRFGLSWPPIAALAVSGAAAAMAVVIEQRRIEYRFQRDMAEAREGLD